MKQILKVVDHYDSREFERKVNELLSDGYIIKDTTILKIEHDFSVFYKAILIKEIEE